MDAQLPNNNVPEESKPSDPNPQPSNTELDGVVGGGKKPTGDSTVKYLEVKLTDVMISS